MSLIDHLRDPDSQLDRVDPRQVKNSAGGYSFSVGPFERLERFLILGTMGGSYYATERELTRESARIVRECLDREPVRTVQTIVDVSQWGRAPKQEPGLLALAIGASHPKPDVRGLVLPALPLVCRTASTLMAWLEMTVAMRGWGAGLQGALADWYTRLSSDDLAYQTLKYRQRNGWTHRDILRKAHIPHARFSPKSQALVRWIIAGPTELEERIIKRSHSGRHEQQPPVGEPPELVGAFETLWGLTESGDGLSLACELIRRHRMPHEMVPDRFKQSPAIWEALMEHMPMGALVRNLGKLSAVGVLTSGSHAVACVVERLSSMEAIRRARLHPMAFLIAQGVYRQGHGDKGKLTWKPVDVIADELEHSFYRAFGNVEPTGKALWLCLDVSGSMQSGTVSGAPNLPPARAAAALALVTLKAEPSAKVFGFGHRFHPIEMDPSWSLERATLAVNLPFESTNCSLPILEAHRRQEKVDGFAVFTDAETWWKDIHPHSALELYRKAMDVPARLAVVGMVGSAFTIANPDDAGMMDFVGFDAHAPTLMSDFFRGKREREKWSWAGQHEASDGG